MSFYDRSFMSDCWAVIREENEKEMKQHWPRPPLGIPNEPDDDPDDEVQL